MAIKDMRSSLVTGCIAGVAMSACQYCDSQNHPAAKVNCPPRRCSPGCSIRQPTSAGSQKVGSSSLSSRLPSTFRTRHNTSCALVGSTKASDRILKIAADSNVLKVVLSKKIVTISAIVPALGSEPARFRHQDPLGKPLPVGVHQGFYTVPVADVRILIFQPSGEVIVDLLTTVGVTQISWAVGGALAAIVAAFVGLWASSYIRRRELEERHPTAPNTRD